VIGPLEAKDFVEEFLADSAAASKKFEKRRVRVVGEITGTSSRLGRHSARISAPSATQLTHNVQLLLDSPANVELGDLVTVEGDFQAFTNNMPQLANCTITKGM
jgi:hypothetical protein